jgi:hypothetical protein
LPWFRHELQYLQRRIVPVTLYFIRFHARLRVLEVFRVHG